MARYSDTLGKWVRGDDVVPVPSASRSASGDSGWLSSEEYRQLALTLDITVDTFTTLDVIVETASSAAGANTATVASFAQQSGVATVRKIFTGLDKFYRVRWTLVGTSGTWSVSGEGK